MSLNRAHIFSPLVLSLLLCSTSCNKDKAEFLTAEKAFNSGSISEADSLYSVFIVKYPTSRLRTVAESQRNICRSILNLQRSAKLADGQKRYDEAINIYKEIAALNEYAIDTVSKFEELRKKREFLEEQEKEKLEKEFIEDLKEDAIVVMFAYEYLIFTLEKADSILTSDLDLFTFLSNWTEEKNWYDPQGKLDALYSKACRSPDKYKKCAVILIDWIRNYYELSHTINEFYQYRLPEFRAMIKSKRNSLGALFKKFSDCGE